MMRIDKYLLVLFLFISAGLSAQDLMVQGSTPDLYLNHNVEPKETWYSLGRMYNLPPKDIAAFNRLSLESGLSVGQGIKVPLRAVNFSQNEVKAADEVFVPVIHTVQDKEWMYRISVNHNKVPVETLERWNNISRDNAVAGTKLIVGFLKVKSAQSPLASRASKINEPLAQSNRVKPADQNIPIPKETPKKESAVEERSTAIVKESQPATPTTPVNNSEPENKIPAGAGTSTPGSFPAGGYFRNQYDNSGKQRSGISGVFKSTSGWKDGKYYALMNNVPVGTIIRVNFPSTNRTIFAKVLGQLPDMRESEGLSLRLSDAAASELGAGYQKFTVDIRH